MVINGKVIDAVDVVVEGRRKPNVLGDDLVSGLDIMTFLLQCIGDAPACSTTRARFLRNGEGNTGLESSDREGAFAIARAAGDGKAFGVDASLPTRLENIAEQRKV